MLADETQLKIQEYKLMTNLWFGIILDRAAFSFKSEANHYMIIEPEAVIATHLNNVLQVFRRFN